MVGGESPHFAGQWLQRFGSRGAGWMPLHQDAGQMPRSGDKLGQLWWLLGRHTLHRPSIQRGSLRWVMAGSIFCKTWKSPEEGSGLALILTNCKVQSAAGAQTKCQDAGLSLRQLGMQRVYLGSGHVPTNGCQLQGAPPSTQRAASPLALSTGPCCGTASPYTCHLLTCGHGHSCPAAGDLVGGQVCLTWLCSSYTLCLPGREL